MRKITKEYTIYKYNELTEKQKEKVLEHLYDLNVDHDWWDSTYEDAENIGLKIKGFDLNRGSYVDGEFTDTAVSVAERILKSHGEKTGTYKTAQDFLTEYNKLSDEEKEEFSSDHEIAEEFLKSLCEDYRIMLSREYDYLTSRESIEETIEANDYEFTEDGHIA